MYMFIVIYVEIKKLKIKYGIKFKIEVIKFDCRYRKLCRLD